jgi:Uma2 family endonuclease
VGEVSDSTLAYDRSEKARLYAEAQIPEYWILNVVGSYLEVRRDPEDGEYRSLQTLRITASVTPLFAPDTSIAIADLLPQEA